MRTPESGGLNQRQVRAAIQIAMGRTLRAAAKEAGCSERACREWCGQPEFQRFVSHLQGMVIRRSIGMLTRATTKAVRRLVKLVDSADESVQLRASMAILDASVRLAEHAELAGRVAELESLAGPPSSNGVHA